MSCKLYRTVDSVKPRTSKYDLLTSIPTNAHTNDPSILLPAREMQVECQVMRTC